MRANNYTHGYCGCSNLLTLSLYLTALFLFQDTAFSILVTAIFLRPILEALREARGAETQTAGYRLMSRTKWATLFGVSLAVTSSTILYVNAALYFVSQRGDLFWTNSLLNLWVFGISADSVANDLGVLLVCGALNALWAKLVKRFASTVQPAAASDIDDQDSGHSSVY